MNYSIKGRNSIEVKIQLKRAEIQKNLCVKKIYKEYENYFEIVRKLILTSAERGIIGIYSDLCISGKVLNTSELKDFLNKNISLLIHSKLPFITIEQLNLSSISDLKKQIVNENAYKEFVEFKEYKTVNFDYETESTAIEPLEFHSNNNSNTYEYYESLSEDQLSSLNLDESDYLYSSSEQISIKKIQDEKNIVNTVLELVEETYDDERTTDQKSDVFISIDNLTFFEFIDKSFDNFLLDLSYVINSELFKINLIEKIISEETFKCLSNNNYITKHPHPFVIRYCLNSSMLSSKNHTTSNIYLFNISNVELEFYNLELSNCRNNINELKNRFRILNKKQRYWENKELSLNNPN